MLCAFPFPRREPSRGAPNEDEAAMAKTTTTSRRGVMEEKVKRPDMIGFVTWISECVPLSSRPPHSIVKYWKMEG